MVTGYQEDAAQMPTLTAEACVLARAGDYPAFINWLVRHSHARRIRMTMYWSMLVVGMRKANDPVEQGLVMDSWDRDALSTLCHHFGAAMLPSDSVQAFRYMETATTEAWQVLTDDIRDSEPAAFPRRLWIVIQVLQAFRSESEVHSVFIARAAMLRMMIFKAVSRVRTHNWHIDDLSAIFEVSRCLDDRNQSVPMDDV